MVTVRSSKTRALRVGAILAAGDAAWKDFVDQWLHIAMADCSFNKIYSAWFE
jgi:ABC-type amino acid transport substrate-binding protein